MSIPPVGGTVMPREGRELITNFHYPTLRFKPVEYVEFPKWVNMTGYDAVLAYDAESEAELLARPEREPTPVKSRKSSPPMQFISSTPIQPATIVPQPRQLPAAYWRRALLWLAHKLEALAYI